MTIRNVPANVRNELAARAARKGQSLQEFMLARLTELASKPSMNDLVDRIEERLKRSGTHVSVEEILADLEADRR